MREMPIVSKVCAFIVAQSELYQERLRREKLLKYGINPDTISKHVNFMKIENIKIGPNTYMNSGQIYAGVKSRAVIGDWCAIGYNVHIRAWTHNPKRPTGPDWSLGDGIIEEDVVIGDYVWIGDNVFIKTGVKIGDHAIIGANSVVTKNVGDYEVVGGSPAKVLYTRDVKDK